MRISWADESAVQLRISQPAAVVMSDIALVDPDYNNLFTVSELKC